MCRMAYVSGKPNRTGPTGHIVGAPPLACGAPDRRSATGTASRRSFLYRGAADALVTMTVSARAFVGTVGGCLTILAWRSATGSVYCVLLLRQRSGAWRRWPRCRTAGRSRCSDNWAFNLVGVAGRSARVAARWRCGWRSRSSTPRSTVGKLRSWRPTWTCGSSIGCSGRGCGALRARRRRGPAVEGFGLVHAWFVLEEHLPEREAVLDRLVGALAPGGWLVEESLWPSRRPWAGRSRCSPTRGSAISAAAPCARGDAGPCPDPLVGRPAAPPEEALTASCASRSSYYVAPWQLGDLDVVAEDAHAVGAAWLGFFTANDPGYGFVDVATPELSMGVVRHGGPAKTATSEGPTATNGRLDHSRPPAARGAAGGRHVGLFRSWRA
jgi:hypothetical protein